MTPMQRDCLRAIERMTAAGGGVAPSLDELAAELGLAGRSSAHRLVEKLIEQGRLRRRAGKFRSLELVNASAASASVETAARAVVAAWKRGALSGHDLATLADALGIEGE